MYALRQHLVVENKVVAIFAERQVGQDLAAEGAIASVILGEFDPRNKFSKAVNKRLATICRGIPPKAVPPIMREPNTTSYTP